MPIPTLDAVFCRVPYPNFKTKFVTKMQSVEDIERSIKSSTAASLPYCVNYAFLFSEKNRLDTCQNIYRFMRKYFTYDEEPDVMQSSKTINRILYDAGGDCKHFSTFAYCTLRALNIPCNYRLCQYDGRNTPTHIYVVAYDRDGTEIIIDGTLSDFNAEIGSKYIYDI